jgi:hypothetical protein
MIDRFGVRASLVASLSLVILSLPFYLKSFRDLKDKKGAITR